jgi:uncharacterized protein YpiB (UPF0302 family)
MDNLVRMEDALGLLLDQHQALKEKNRELLAQRVQWQEERRYLLREIDQMLERLADLPVEEL